VNPYVTIFKFCDDTGYTVKAVRRKIEDGVWIEGKHYRRSPDGRIHINVIEYVKWVESSSLAV